MVRENLKLLTASELDKVFNVLYSKSTNRSKAKDKEDVVGQTPLEDKRKKLTEWDLCKNRTYDSYFIKCFYDNNTKSYRYDIPHKDLHLWVRVMLSDVPTEISSILDDIGIEF